MEKLRIPAGASRKNVFDTYAFWLKLGFFFFFYSGRLPKRQNCRWKFQMNSLRFIIRDYHDISVKIPGYFTDYRDSTLESFVTPADSTVGIRTKHTKLRKLVRFLCFCYSRIIIIIYISVFCSFYRPRRGISSRYLPFSTIIHNRKFNSRPFFFSSRDISRRTRSRIVRKFKKKTTYEHR